MRDRGREDGLTATGASVIRDGLDVPQFLPRPVAPALAPCAPMAYRAALWLFCLVLGCEEQANPGDPERPAAAAPPPLDRARDGVTAHMPKHLLDATAVRDAIVLGRLDDAKAPADTLATHWPDQVLSEWVPFVVDLRTAAAAVARADTIDAACAPTGAVAFACGQCHAALRRGPAFVSPPKPQAGADTKANMQIHRWAADRLWDSVVQARDEPWQEGLNAFLALPPCADDPDGDRLNPEFDRARARFESALTDAAGATELDDRARRYSELLRTCHGCHTAGC